MVSLNPFIMQRRKLLQTISTGSLAITGVPKAFASEDVEHARSIEHEDLKGSQRSSLIRQVKNDNDANTLINEIENDGWRLDWSDALVRRVTDPKKEGKYDFVFVEGEPTNPDFSTDDLTLLWFGNNTVDLEIENHTFTHHMMVDEEYAQVTNSDSSGLFGYDASKSYTPGTTGAEVAMANFHSQEITVQSPGGPQEPIPCGNPPCNGDDGPPTWVPADIELIEDEGIDWPCIAVAYAGAATTGLACGGCIAVGWTGVGVAACAGCLLGFIVYNVSMYQCFAGGEPTTVDIFTGELRYSFLEEHNIPITEFAPSNSKRAEIPLSVYEEENVVRE